MALYDETDGDNWTDFAGWLEVGTPISQWSGVTVSGGTVTDLDLSFNGLSGSMPAELGQLSNLRELRLQYNSLRGDIPAELGQLSDLRWLYVSNNQLSGSIPPELGALSNLEFLYLFNNRLSGSIPPELAQLEILRNLYLHGNQLSGSVPPELSSLRELETLYLNNNDLSGRIPEELGQLTGLLSLDLRANGLSGPIPLTFTNLTALVSFFFSGTGLCEPQDRDFQAWLGGVPAVRSTGEACTDGGSSNAPPQFTTALDDREIPAGETFIFDYDATDPDGDALTFDLTQAPDRAEIDPNGSFRWTPLETQAGDQFEVTVAVSDGTDAADTTATLTVAANQPPRLYSGVGTMVTDVGDALILRLQVIAQDPDGDALTFTLEEAPSEGTLDIDGNEATFRFTSVPSPGLYRIVVRVSDGALSATSVGAVLLRGPLFPELEDEALREALRTAYVPSQTLGYGPARDSLYKALARLEGGDVCGVYTGYCVPLPDGVDPSAYLASYDDGDASNGTSDGINAEHIWPQSKGAGEEPQRSDMHILYPSKENVNGVRGNAPYVEIPDEETDGWYRLDESQSTIPTEDVDSWSEKDNENPDPGYDARFEPREQVKGDLARAAFYFYVIYQAEAEAADPNFYGAQAEHLVAWNVADPVSTDEARRGAEIMRLQGQPNPFIIDVTLAPRITGAASSAEDLGVPGAGYLVTAPYPNPARSAARLTVRVQQRQQVEIVVYDLLGRAMQTVLDQALLPETAREIELDTSRLPAGVYLVRTRGETFTATRKLVVVR